MDYSINKYNVIVHNSIDCGEKTYTTAVPIRRSCNGFDATDLDIAKDVSKEMIVKLKDICDQIPDELLICEECNSGDIVELECKRNTDIVISFIRYANHWYINDIKYEPIG